MFLYICLSTLLKLCQISACGSHGVLKVASLWSGEYHYQQFPMAFYPTSFKDELETKKLWAFGEASLKIKSTRGSTPSSNSRYKKEQGCKRWSIKTWRRQMISMQRHTQMLSWKGRRIRIRTSNAHLDEAKRFPNLGYALGFAAPTISFCVAQGKHLSQNT